jgi:apolipoprotein N-acyltransferase
VLGFVLRFKFLENWRLILQVVGVIALGAGLYMKGGYEVEMQWRNRVAEMEAKVAVAEAKSKETNTVIQERVVTKIKRVKEVQVKNKEIIKQVEHIINAECTVPKEAIEILNAAARNDEAVVTKGLAQ